MKRAFVSVLVCCFAVTLLCSPGRAQSEPISREDLLFMEIPIVITATLTEKSLDKTPASVTVITEKEIRGSGARDLMDLLNRVNGVMYYYSFFTGPAIANLRGVSGYGKIKTLINGHSLDSGMWNFSLYANMGLENIKQIEIVRGPGSALYGTNAYAGIINIITHTSRDKEGLFLDGKYGSYNTNRVNAYYGKAYTNGSVGINLHEYNYDRTGIYFEKDKFAGMFFSQSPGEAEEKNQDIEAHVDASYKNLVIEAHAVNEKRHFPVTELGTLTDEGQKADNNLMYVEARHTQELLPLLLLKTKLSYDYVDFKNFGTLMPKNFTVGADVNGDGIFDIWPDGGYADYGYKSDQLRSEALLDYTFSWQNELLVGVFYEYMRTLDVYLKSDANPLYFFKYPAVVDLSDTFNWNKPAQRGIYGAFFQDEWNITKEWYLLLGSRYDHYDDVGGSFNPRCGIVWNVCSNTTAKLLYNSAFRAPSFADLYNQNNPSVVGNPDLKPETIESYEIALNHVWAARVSTDLSVYTSKADNLLAVSGRNPLDPLAPVYWINRNRSKVWGFELNEKYTFARNNYMYAGYSYTEAKDDILDTYLPDVPRNQVSGGFHIAFTEAINGDVSANYIDEIKRATWDNQPPLPSFTLVNMALQYSVLDNLTVTCGVYNLLDTKYYYPPVADVSPLSDKREPGINYMAGVSYKY